MNKPKTKIVHNFTVDIDVYIELKAYSEKSMIPMSQLVNRLLKEYLKSNTNTKSNN